MYYQFIDAGKEKIGIVWQYERERLTLERIYLPRRKDELLAEIRKEFPKINKTTRKIPGDIAKQIAKIYAGEKINFDLSLLNLAKLKKFAERVLLQACKIPSGKVVTYSGLACKIGSPLAARAVGTALANNPFPLIIPCHRIVRSDGSLGGFGGGIKMKKELLVKEGIVFNGTGRVSAECFYP